MPFCFVSQVLRIAMQEDFARNKNSQRITGGMQYLKGAQHSAMAAPPMAALVLRCVVTCCSFSHFRTCLHVPDGDQEG